jgi:YidC/Oxa1 family membrane protein insertase
LDFIAKPFGWLLMLLYDFIGNYGLAVVLFALVVKGILLPFQMKSKRSTMKTARLQPKIKELEKRHGANKQKLNEEMAKMYREEKINPASGCLWNLIPLPIIIALFQAVSRPMTIMMGVSQSLLDKGGTIYNLLEKMGGPIAGNTYLQIAQTEFISKPENFSAFAPLSSALRQIDYNFLGMRLGDTPQWNFLWKTDWSNISIWGPGLLLFLLPIVSGVLTYFSSQISMKLNPSMGNAQQQSSAKSMMLMMPLISVYFAFVMPGAIGIYIIASTLFAMIQDIILTKHYTKVLEAEEAVKLEQQRIREAELEAKREETERKRLENNTEKNPNTSKKKQLKSERQEQLTKAAEWEKKHSGEPKETVDPARVGERKFARGRAYDPTRYENPAETEATPESDEPVMTADPQDGVPMTAEPVAAETLDGTLSENNTDKEAE